MYFDFFKRIILYKLNEVIHKEGHPFLELWNRRIHKFNQNLCAVTHNNFLTCYIGRLAGNYQLW